MGPLIVVPHVLAKCDPTSVVVVGGVIVSAVAVCPLRVFFHVRGVLVGPLSLLICVGSYTAWSRNVFLLGRAAEFTFVIAR